MAAKTFAATTEKKRKQYLANFEDNRPCNIFKVDNDFPQTTPIWQWSLGYFYLVLVEINPLILLEMLNCWATNATFGFVTFRADPITIWSGSLYQLPLDQSGEQNVALNNAGRGSNLRPAPSRTICRIDVSGRAVSRGTAFIFSD